MARGNFHRTQGPTPWPQRAVLALAAGIVCWTGVIGPAWGNNADPPRAVHVPYKEVTFADPSLSAEYGRRCAADLQILNRFFGSAAAAEQWLDGRAGAKGSRKQEQAGRALVRQAILDHRDASDALFKCIGLVSTAQKYASGADLTAADWAMQLHQGTLTSIDGRIIQLLIRHEGFTF